MRLTKAASYALIAFFAAWQATEFSLEYRAVMGACVAGLMGLLSPNGAASTTETDQIS